MSMWNSGTGLQADEKEFSVLHRRHFKVALVLPWVSFQI